MIRKCDGHGHQGSWEGAGGSLPQIRLNRSRELRQRGCDREKQTCEAMVPVPKQADSHRTGEFCEAAPRAAGRTTMSVRGVPHGRGGPATARCSLAVQARGRQRSEEHGCQAVRLQRLLWGWRWAGEGARYSGLLLPLPEEAWLELTHSQEQGTSHMCVICQ